MKNISFKFILFHIIAAWFFIHAFATASLLFDVALVKGFITEGESYFSTANIGPRRISNFLVATGLSRFLGFIVSVCISFIITRKHKVHWLNVLPLFIVGYFFLFYDFLGWNYLKFIFLLPGDASDIVSVKLTINSVVLLLLGMAVFRFAPIKDKTKDIYNDEKPVANATN
ncbi:MAG: hypothetical protein ACOVRN_10775 [Flavobacterium sp.]